MIQINDGMATKALVSFSTEQPTRKRPAAGFPSVVGVRSTENQRSAPLKRSRFGLSGSFDMGDFLKASQQVEDTIAFPAIEWPSFDDDDSSSDNASGATLLTPSLREGFDSDDDDEDDFGSCRRKRQCRGLTRSDRSCNLSSLNISNHTQRRGSNGSLS